VNKLNIVIGSILATTIAASNADGAEVAADNKIGVEVGVLFVGHAKHITTKFAPAGGYNENNHTIGLEILQDKDGWAYGGSVSKFDDSFAKSSYWLLATLEYRKTFKHVSASAGIGAGLLKTSYYNGPFATPFIKLRHNGTGLYCKAMVQPFSSNQVDSFAAVTGGISKKF